MARKATALPDNATATAVAVSSPTSPTPAKQATPGEVLRQPAETKYADELTFLASVDKSPRPFTWNLSPRMVRTFVLGSRPADKLERDIRQKFYGDPTVVERA